MIEKLIAFCARHRGLVFLLTAALSAWGVYAVKHVPLDALPDLSDTQVIIYSRWDRSPDIVEDQVTYPIVTAMLGAPKVKAIRGFSDFGFSYVYIIFEDGTDIYWARSRTLEYLSKILPRLPEGVKTELGPDATGVGWVYQYALVDRTGRHNLAELRGFQDWYLRYWLQSVPGVAEVASIGGFQKQYQVQVRPNALVAYNIPITKVVEAIRAGNNDVGGRLVEFSGTEYMVRGRGYAKNIEDIEAIVVGRGPGGTPVLVKNVASVTLGPDIRRGVSDLDGQGDTVGGIIVMRQGENALQVIDRVKNKIEEIKPSLPPGVEILPTYDRSDLIRQAIRTIGEALTWEMIIVCLVIIVFLLHFPSALLPILTLPVATLLSFIPMYFMRITSSIMSLGGIAVAVGDMVDASIVMAENAHKRTEEWIEKGRVGDYRAVLVRAMQEVGPSAFYSLMVMAVAFLPIFALEGQAGRLFKPLAYTKNLALAMAAILAITLAPAIRTLLIRTEPYRFKPRWLSRLATWLLVGKMYAEEEHPISRPMFRLYEPAVRWVLDHRGAVIGSALGLVLITIPVFMRLGSEFMPPLEEGSILFMPTTLPGLSVTEAQKLMQAQDKILKGFPEVERVFGKAGRAETSTDPAPFSMMETTVVLKPESEWRKISRWYSGWPDILQGPFRLIWPDRLTYNQLIDEMDRHLRFPGVANAWTMPIKNRIDMLSTGVRTPVGIKVLGADLQEIEAVGAHLEMILKEVRGTRSVFAERTTGGYFLDFKLRRDQLARFGLTIDEANRVIMTAIGGETVTTTIEGRERYTVNVRYPRELRDNLDDLKRVLVPTPQGAHIPLAQIAEISLMQGASMIRNENGMLAGYVYIDITGRDVGGYVTEAKRIVREKLALKPGYALVWSGQYEQLESMKRRMAVVVPLTLFIILLLLYMSTRSGVKTAIVLTAVPFSAIGAFWTLWLLDYNMSAAVWAGVIALLGLDAETGVFMLLYLDLAYNDRVREGRMKTSEDLKEAIVHGSVRRIRPKVMTVMTNFLGFMPIMWSGGLGADMMKRVAAPMVGGLFTSFILELLVYPAIYFIWKWRYELKQGTVDVSALPIPEIREDSA
ncbi:MAG: cation transporter [Elusimicrobia bacterium RIFCSPLOWO2_01_FULL_59_12]|nr:MAG: cation transporter [Elusimicrobia bacterium RIFCSPLOWO2_01_FULL_59_12]